MTRFLNMKNGSKIMKWRCKLDNNSWIREDHTSNEEEEYLFIVF